MPFTKVCPGFRGVLAGGTQEEQSLKTTCRPISIARGRRAFLPAGSCLLALFCLAVAGSSPEANEDKAAKAKAKAEPKPLNWHTSLKKAAAVATRRERPIVCVFWGTGSKAHDWFAPSEKSGRKPGSSLRPRGSSRPKGRVHRPSGWRRGRRSTLRSKWISRYAVHGGPAGSESGDAGAGEDDSRSAIERANVVLLKAKPPAKFSAPAGAPPGKVSQLRKASRLLWDRYAKLARKYRVTHVPTVLFLSPDGETVLARYVRQPESRVEAGLEKLEALFTEYKELRAAAAAAEKEKRAPGLPPGDARPEDGTGNVSPPAGKSKGAGKKAEKEKVVQEGGSEDF